MIIKIFLLALTPEHIPYLKFTQMKISFVLTLVTLFTISLHAQTIHNQAPIRIETPHNWSKDKVKRETAVYTAPANAYIHKATLRVVSANGPVTHKIIMTQTNSSLITIQEARQEFENQRQYVLNLNLPSNIQADLLADINERQTAYEKRYFELASSHSSVIHEASASGQGSLSFRGRSWYEGNVSIELVTSAPEFEQVSSLRSTQKRRFDLELSKKRLSPYQINPNVGVVPNGTIKVNKTAPAKLRKIGIKGN